MRCVDRGSRPVARCSLCAAQVTYAKTAASGGRKAMMVVPDPGGQCWFERGTDYKNRPANLLIVASKEHPRPESGVRFFRQHQFDCGPYKAKKEIEAALKRSAAQVGGDG